MSKIPLKIRKIIISELLDLNRGQIYQDFTDGKETRNSFWALQPDTVQEYGGEKFTSDNCVGCNDDVNEDLEYSHVDDATKDEFELSEERKKSYMPNSKTVTVKKKCRLGGLGNTSAACNQGDISNLEFKSINEDGSENVFNITPEIKDYVSKFKSDEELLRSGGLPIELLDMVAHGFTEENVKQLMPDQLNIKWKDDLDNVKHEIKHKGLSDEEYANSIDLSEPVDVVYENDKFYVDDGHHRYYAAKILNKPLNVNLKIKSNPIKKLAPDMGYDEFHRYIWNLVNSSKEENKLSEIVRETYQEFIDEDFVAHGPNGDEMFINPKSIDRMKPYIRGIADSNGNLYLIDSHNYIHTTISRLFNQRGYQLPIEFDYPKDHKRFIGLQRNGDTNDFYLSESYTSDEYVEENLDNIVNILDKTKAKNPTYDFIPENIKRSRRALEINEVTEGGGYLVYHGSPKEIKNFSDEFVGANEATDQEGPGIYFTTSYDDARGYGEYVHVVRLSPRKLVDESSHEDISQEEIIKLIKMSSDWESHAQNWAEDPETGVLAAYNSLMEFSDNEKDLFQQIWYDFFRYNPQEFVRGMVQLGYDGQIINKEEGRKHIIIYNPNVIQLQDIEKDKPEVNEEVDGQDVTDQNNALQSIIDGKRNIGFISLDNEINSIFEKSGLNKLGPINQKDLGKKNNFHVVYRPEYKNDALELFTILAQKGGYLKDNNPKEAYRIGKLLGYTDSSIKTYNERKYGNNNLNEGNIMTIQELPFKDDIQKHGGKIYSVGGAVRDEFIGKESKDLDILITGIPMDKLATILSQYGKVDAVGKSFGILKFTPKGGEEVDVAIPRTEVASGDGGHKGFDVTSDHKLPIEDDLRRRDFTINAIAKDIDGNLIDPFGGQQDLQNKIIKVVNPEAFSDDPLRMLRAVQFASRFGFTIEPKTLEMIKKNARRINEIAPERIITEFDKIVQKGDARYGAQLLKDTGLFKNIFGFDLKQSMIDRYNFEGVKTMGEFIYLLTKLSPNPAEFYKETLKGDIDTFKEIKALDFALSSDNINDPVKNRSIIHNMLSVSPKTIQSELLPQNLKVAANELMSGKFPKTLKELDIDGNDLMRLGYKGQDIGQTLKTLLIKVYGGKLRNIKDELLNSLNQSGNLTESKKDSKYKNTKESLLRSKSIKKEMKDKILPYLQGGSTYHEGGRVRGLRIPKVKGKSFDGVSLGADKDGFYVYTHRAASKRYESPDKISNKDIKFIESTG